MEAITQSPLIFFKENNNVSKMERILMLAGGALILCNGLKNKDKSFTQTSIGSAMLLRGITGYCPVYDVLEQSKKLKSNDINIKIISSINLPVAEVYNFWRNLENLPKFMTHLESVKNISDKTSQWTAKGPAGIGTVTWKAEIVKDEKEKLLSWHSLPESTIENEGIVVFRSKENTTELDILISYRAPMGGPGEVIANLLNPLFEKMITDDINKLKTYLESGQK
ncbi:SRPBCC family protein [Flavobacterium sp. LS1P3]|jgi:uncharacterized membrane protein|uniref:SRPBCC family protein n=1 Tax=Flavobacterium sp. LS1P3 TaxID=3401720 RepID=UPI003AAA9A86